MAAAAEPGSTRDYPVPVGTAAQVGDYSMTILGITSNANSVVATASQFNSPPAAGRQFFMARVSIAYSGRESGLPRVALGLQVVGDRNVGYSTGRDSCGSIPDDFGDAPELFEGGQVEVNVCWSVDITDVGSLVMYAEQYFSESGRVWFSLGSTTETSTSSSDRSTSDDKKIPVPTIELTMVDLAFEPKNFIIPPDTDVKIVVTNKGVLTHDFVIESEGIASGPVLGGDSAEIVVNLPTGAYQFWCMEPGHKEAGMVGTLTVQSVGDVEAPPSPTTVSTTSVVSPTSFSLDTVDLAFKPIELTIPADTNVTLTVTNKGVLQHDFHIDGTDIFSAILNGGELDKVVVNLPAGTYQFWCTVPGHKEAGMVGTLIVE